MTSRRDRPSRGRIRRASRGPCAASARENSRGGRWSSREWETLLEKRAADQRRKLPFHPERVKRAELFSCRAWRGAQRPFRDASRSDLNSASAFHVGTVSALPMVVPSL